MVHPLSFLAFWTGRVYYVHRLDPTKPFPPFKWLNTSVDVYDRHTGAKLYEDVPLPDGSEVLGGGRFLYLLTNREEPPWRIAKLRLRTS